jgi:two-component system response regulator CpxR
VRASPPSVLLVEDDPDLRLTLAELIAGEGYPVGEAEHGAAALEWLGANPAPGIVLLDLAMPVMNGLRFREQQLADPRLASIATFALTASRTTQDQLAHLRFDGILYKPLDVRELLAALERHCGAAQVDPLPDGGR